MHFERCIGVMEVGHTCVHQRDKSQCLAMTVTVRVRHVLATNTYVDQAYCMSQGMKGLARKCAHHSDMPNTKRGDI